MIYFEALSFLGVDLPLFGRPEELCHFILDKSLLTMLTIYAYVTFSISRMAKSPFQL